MKGKQLSDFLALLQLSIEGQKALDALHDDLNQNKNNKDYTFPISISNAIKKILDPHSAFDDFRDALHKAANADLKKLALQFDQFNRPNKLILENMRLKDKITGKKNVIRNLTAQIDKLQEKIDADKRVISGIRSEINEIETQISKLEESILALRPSIDEIDDMVNININSRNITNTKLEEAENCLNEFYAVSRLRDVYVDIEKCKILIATYKAAIKKYTDHIDQLKDVNQELYTELRKESETLDDKQSSKSLLEQSLRDVKTRKAQKSRESSRLATQLSSLKNEIDELKTQINSSNNELKQFKK